MFYFFKIYTEMMKFLWESLWIEWRDLKQVSDFLSNSPAKILKNLFYFNVLIFICFRLKVDWWCSSDNDAAIGKYWSLDLWIFGNQRTGSGDENLFSIRGFHQRYSDDGLILPWMSELPFRQYIIFLNFEYEIVSLLC